jgi:glutathione S-transferase
VVDHFDPLAPPGRRLLLNGPDAAGVEADWAAYNGAFAVDVAVFSYYHLLPARALMVPIFAAPVPPAEAQVTPRVYPVLRKFFATLLQLRPERAHEASRRIQAVFAAMDRRLGDGRRFLCGSRLTLGDIGFAGAVAPLLQPAGYGAQMPNVEAMPEAIRNTIGELRSYRAARYLDRIYSRVFENKASPHMY